MFRTALLVSALALAPAVARADDFSTDTLTTTAVQVVPPTPLQRAFYRFCVKANSAAGAWLSRRDHSPGPNGVGSYYLAPGKCEEFQRPQFIPPSEVWAAAESGTVKIAVEVY